MKNNAPVRINRKYLRAVKSILKELDKFERTLEKRKEVS